MKITIYAKKCPHCHYTLEEDWSGVIYSIFGIFMLLLLPALISYWLIKALGFGDPDIPKIGDKVIRCPSCSLPIRTNMVAIGDLNAKQLLTYRFRAWFIVAYVIGGIFAFSALYMVAECLPIISWWGLTLLLSFLGVMAIIITYRIKLARC